MTEEKFNAEIHTLKNFFEVYCKDKHDYYKEKKQTLKFNGKDFEIDLCLCDECSDAINYSFQRLQECPHDIKPRCRTCPSPCYEKARWKNTARVMKYSAIKLSLSKVKHRVKSLFS